MIELITATFLQAYPMYFAAIPFVILGLLIRKKKSTCQSSVYLGDLAFVLLCSSILVTLAATCYSKEFFDNFDIKRLLHMSKFILTLRVFCQIFCWLVLQGVSMLL